LGGAGIGIRLNTWQRFGFLVIVAMSNRHDFAVIEDGASRWGGAMA
jgi:hypothetical protein